MGIPGKPEAFYSTRRAWQAWADEIKDGSTRTTLHSPDTPDANSSLGKVSSALGSSTIDSRSMVINSTTNPVHTFLDIYVLNNLVNGLGRRAPSWRATAKLVVRVSGHVAIKLGLQHTALCIVSRRRVPTTSKRCHSADESE